MLYKNENKLQVFHALFLKNRTITMQTASYKTKSIIITPVLHSTTLHSYDYDPDSVIDGENFEIFRILFSCLLLPFR